VKSFRAYLLSLTGAISFAVGFGAHRFVDSGPPFPEYDVPGEERNASRSAKVFGTIPMAYGRSSDTAEQLLNLDQASLPGRLGLWLMDASEDQIEKFWAEYGKRKPLDSWTATLIFHYWTKLNPRTAMEVARRYGVEYAAIDGWMMHDPDAALAAVAGSERLIQEHARAALTRFHPKLGAKLAREDRSAAHMLDLEKIANDMALEDPEEAMDFLLEMGQTHFTSALEQWTKEDPEAALAWMRDHWGKKSLTEAFLTMCAEAHPKRMKEWAAELPSGVMKRDIEKKLFEGLVKTDPVAALEEARKLTSSRLAAEQFSAVGKAMVQENPQAALGVMRELFAACPDASAREMGAFTPDGFEYIERGVDGVEEFLADLVAWNPGTTMAAAVQLSGRPDDLFMNDQDAMSTVARLWVEKDAVGFAEWCGAQDNAGIRGEGIDLAAWQLSQKERYADSLHWAMQGGGSQVQDVFRKWLGADREAAVVWFNETELPDPVRDEMSKTLENTKQP
jgi:hypothetical protein